MTSLKDINDPTEAMNATLILFAKAFQLTATTNNNQRISSNPHNRIANQNRTGNVVAARAEGIGNGNQARSTQQDIYAAGSENHPPMLNKDNYVPWSSRIIRYARSRPNGKIIVDSIENGPYIRRMITTPGEPYLPVLVLESFHEQTDEELTENDIKRMDADDKAI
nr:hypothetical protein [Tanacetum cinerariifolium]